MDEEEERGILRYYNAHITQVEVGHTFRIHGNISENGKVFTIDFITNLVEDIYRDIALRITGRVSEEVLTRSYRRADNWSNEEVISRTPCKIKLNADNPITIEVYTLENEFLISLNGFHYASFEHRFPFCKIRIIEIRGDIENITIDQRIAMEYPLRPVNAPNFGTVYNTNIGIAESSKVKRQYLPLPFIASFDADFLTECNVLIITGIVTDGAKYFNVILQTGSHYYPPPHICYDVKFYFVTETSNEIHPHKGPDNEIVHVKPDEKIKLQLVHEKSGFYGVINNQQFPVRPFKIDPKFVNTVLVCGDFKLLDILIES